MGTPRFPRLYDFFLAFCASLISLPLILFGRPGTLDGMADPVSLPELSLDGWLSGRLQHQAEAYFERHLGLREPLVRGINQLYLQAFDRSYMAQGTLVIGKRGFLFERAYIQNHCGAPALDLDSLTGRTVERLEELQRRLAARGAALVVVLTPSKAALMPDVIPDGMCPPGAPRDPAYHAAIERLRSSGLPVVDGHQVLSRVRAVEPDAELFPPCGTHYDSVGAYHVSRALMEMLARHSPFHGGIELSSHRRLRALGTEAADLASLLNVVNHPDICDAEVASTAIRKAPARLSLVAVGGSFLREPLHALAATEAFQRLDHYYYFRRELRHVTASAFERANVDVATLDWEGQIASADVVLIEANMGQLALPHVQAFITEALAKLPARPAERAR